jgi:phosphotriesterase-related protein
MATIHTVTGAIDSNELGCTLIHEHLRVRSDEVFFQFPHLYDEEEEFTRAVEQVEAVKRHGVKTIFDPTVMGLGRDVRFMEKVARRTGVQIVGATGAYTFHYLPTRFQAQDIDFLADQFVRDFEQGIQHTSIKPGFLKCATDAQGITPDVEKTIRAVARAHHRTGLPIMTHSHPASDNGLLQLELFEQEGVKPSYILIGHCGDTDDIDYILRVIEKGAYVGMDRYGLIRMISVEKRIATVVELARRGYSDRMFLSQDYCCSSDKYKPESIKKIVAPKWSMTYIFEEIIPILLGEGVTKSQIHTMLYENPKKWVEGR